MRLSWASDGQPNRLNAWPASFDFEFPITQVHVPFMARAMEANIRDIVQDTVLELFDMLGKGEAGLHSDCLQHVCGQVTMNRVRSVVCPALSWNS